MQCSEPRPHPRFALAVRRVGKFSEEGCANLWITVERRSNEVEPCLPVGILNALGLLSQHLLDIGYITHSECLSERREVPF